MDPQKRRIHFSNIVITHLMIMHNNDYRLSRISTWEQMARDRDRFQRRIRNTEQLLITVFNPHHRDCVFHEREH